MNNPERDDWPSVETDDRCEYCPAGEGEDCTADCDCPACERIRREWAQLVELERVDG